MACILLIDDDAALLDVLSMSVEDAGHTVHTASDGLEGLRQQADQAPDIIVSDVNMPRLDGFSLCRRLREDGCKTPIILLTSRDSEIDEALGLDLGADDGFDVLGLVVLQFFVLLLGEVAEGAVAGEPPGGGFGFGKCGGAT